MAGEFANIQKSLPNLGIGLGLRRELASDTFDHKGRVDWVEFVPENYMGIGGRAKAVLEQASERFPLISHGINLSVGSIDDLNVEYLKALKKLLDDYDIPWFSDHLCFSSANGVYMHDLLPLPFSKEAVKHVAARVKKIQDFIERPFLLENISFYMHPPGAEMTESQFLAEVLEEADCGLLLDVNNIYVNSVNHKFDPFQYLKEIPLERTVQIHVAGHKKVRNLIIDTHGSDVIPDVYKLLEQVLNAVKVKAVMLERDQNFPDFEEILNEVDKIRQIAVKAGKEKTHA